MHKSSKELRRQHQEIFEKKTRAEKYPSANAAKWFHRAPYCGTEQEVVTHGK